MNTQEMHIGIDLGLQRINSQSTKNILPQEKDWFLNNEVIDYLQQKTYSSTNIKQLGFEDNAKRVEDIKDLVRVKNLPIELNSRGKNFITFPSNYFSYISFKTYSFKDCKGIQPIPTTTLQYKAVFKIEIPTVLTTYKIDIVTSTGTTTIFTLNDLPNGYLTDADYKRQTFLLTKALKILLPNKIDEALSPISSLYWEKEGYTYNQDSFTLTSSTPFLSVNITINSDPAVVNIATNKSLNFYAIGDTPLKGKTRVLDDEFLADAEISHLSKSTAYSPLSVVRENVLELSETNNAIYGSVDIVYICTPDIIDLHLNSNLNVSEKVAKEIVRNTVTFLKGILHSKDYATYARENVLTE